jgi:hypothetical protein
MPDAYSYAHNQKASADMAEMIFLGIFHLHRSLLGLLGLRASY